MHFLWGAQNWQVLILFLLVLFAFWFWNVITNGSGRLYIFLSGTVVVYLSLRNRTILCTVSFSNGSENNSSNQNTKEWTCLLPAFMRSNCRTKTFPKDDWFVISPSTLFISNRLLLSFAMNVKLLDLFWLAKAIFCFIKTCWLTCGKIKAIRNILCNSTIVVT